MQQNGPTHLGSEGQTPGAHAAMVQTHRGTAWSGIGAAGRRAHLTAY